MNNTTDKNNKNFTVFPKTIKRVKISYNSYGLNLFA